MAENVPSTALEGLGNALDLTGERSAPPGIELSLPAQTVHDLTPYVRYGSAHRFGKFSDGWMTLVVRDIVVGASFAFTNINDWSANVSGSFGISSGRLARMALWVYGVSLEVIATTTLDDIGACSLDIKVPASILLNSGTLTEHVLFASRGGTAQQVQTAALEVRILNEVQPYWPFQWAAGQQGVFRNQNPNATNTVQYEWTLLCRMIPMGQAPLP